MTDREAFRSMLVYAQREANMLDMTAVAEALSLAIAEVDMAPVPARGSASAQCDRLIFSEAAADAEMHGHFATRRLQ